MVCAGLFLIATCSAMNFMSEYNYNTSYLTPNRQSTPLLLIVIIAPFKEQLEILRYFCSCGTWALRGFFLRKGGGG